MWTRAELKSRAKECLKRYYWAAFVVSLIFSIISGFGGGGTGGSSAGDTADITIGGADFNLGAGGGHAAYRMGEELFDELDLDVPDEIYRVPGLIDMLPGSGHNSGGSNLLLNRIFWGLFAGILVVLVIISLLIAVFVAPALEVGKNRFYMESRAMGQSAGVGRLFWGFSNRYLNIIWTMFLRSLFILLGSLCCVVPGIYLTYCYYMVPYILSENPDMKPMEAMRLSRQMMEGHKWNTFVLEMSFIGWYLLGLLACGIGAFFVQPYEEATYAELYAVLRRPYNGRLAGFGIPDVVNSGSWGGSYVEPDRVYNSGNGYGPQDGGWTPDGSQTGGSSGQDHGTGKEDRGPDVTRSEGGPGRGYYLNGVFYPYSDDDK